MAFTPELPKPKCKLGYTESQVDAILEDYGRTPEEFAAWMRGQTMAICEGRAYNHTTKEWEEACGGVAHGIIIYTWDLQRFLDGRPVID